MAPPSSPALHRRAVDDLADDPLDRHGGAGTPPRGGDVDHGPREVARAPTPLAWERLGLALAAAILVGQAALTIGTDPLWLDEAYTLGAVNDPGQSLTRTHGTMGLYYVVMWAWGQVSTSSWWLRTPSLLYALATLAVLRPIARRIGGPRLVAVGLPVLALNQMFAWKAMEARAYSMETLIVTLSWAAALRAVGLLGSRADHRWWLVTIPLAVAGTFCHGLFVVQLAPIIVVAAASRRPVRAVAAMVPAVTAAALTALALRTAGASDVGTNVPGGPGPWIGAWMDELLSRSPALKVALAEVVAVGLVLGVRQAWRARQDPEARVCALVPAAWAVVPALALGLVSTIDPVFNPRYLAPSVVGLALVVGCALTRVPVPLRSRPLTAVAAAVAVGTLVAAAVVAPPYMAEDWSAAARIVAQGAEPGDGVVFANLEEGEPVQSRPPFEAAWADLDTAVTPVVLSSDRDLGRVQRYDAPRTLAQMAAATASRDRVWMVLTHGLGDDNARRIDSSALAGFAQVQSWPVDDVVEVRLYEDRA